MTKTAAAESACRELDSLRLQVRGIWDSEAELQLDDQLRENLEELNTLLTLIYYPEEKLARLRADGQTTDDWCVVGRRSSVVVHHTRRRRASASTATPLKPTIRSAARSETLSATQPVIGGMTIKPV